MKNKWKKFSQCLCLNPCHGRLTSGRKTQEGKAVSLTSRTWNDHQSQGPVVKSAGHSVLLSFSTHGQYNIKWTACWYSALAPPSSTNSESKLRMKQVNLKPLMHAFYVKTNVQIHQKNQREREKEKLDFFSTAEAKKRLKKMRCQPGRTFKVREDTSCRADTLQFPCKL